MSVADKGRRIGLALVAAALGGMATADIGPSFPAATLRNHSKGSPSYTKRGPGRRPAHKIPPNRPGTKLRRLAREGGLA